MNLRLTFGCLLLLLSQAVFSQSFELMDKLEAYQGSISQTVKIPIKIRNTGDKSQFYVIKLAESELSGTQKGYFCFEKTCLEPGVIEFSKKVDAGITLEGLYYVLETGLVAGQYPIKFEVFAKGFYNTIEEYPVNVSIEERALKAYVFQSKDITINDIYPNPVSDLAFIDYKLHNEAVKAKVIVHNILGSSINDLALPFGETRVKIEASDMVSGVYFYTVYLDNVGVITRKMIVRR